MATQTAPAQWWAESSETIATVLDILWKQADAMKQNG